MGLYIGDCDDSDDGNEVKWYCVGSGHCLKTLGGGCVTKASAVKYITQYLRQDIDGSKLWSQILSSG